MEVVKKLGAEVSTFDGLDGDLMSRFLVVSLIHRREAPLPQKTDGRASSSSTNLVVES